jgi:chromosome segregation protein
MLKALELVGFKSFADRTRFEFPPGITVVVGPNGSGKSNIVDAIKWVLGEQSVKSLRGKEMADVIFNGSGARRAMNSAEITLTFDNAGGRLAVDTPEVHITRRVYRSGEGEYLINRQPCRLRDIRDLLAGTGLGTQAYSVIEQGKVDILLQSSSQDRRMIFEEAAGISRFKAKKIEALRRLERVEQNLLRLSDIVEEVESRLRSVRQQAGKARRYKEYSDRLQELRTQVGLVDWQRLSRQLAGLEGETRNLTDQRDAAIAEAESLEARWLVAETQLGEVNEAIRQSEARLAANRQRITAAESTIEHQRAHGRDLDEEIARHRQQLAAMNVRAGDLKQQLDETGDAVQAAIDRHRQIARTLAQSERGMTELIARLDQLRGENQQRRTSHLEQMRAVASLASEISRWESQAAAALAARDRNRQKLDELDGQLAVVEGQLVELQRQREELSAEVDRRQQEHASAITRLGELRRQQAQRQAELAQHQQRRSGLFERISVLEELEKRHEGLSPGVKEVLNQARGKDPGPFRSACGLVADLFHVGVESAMLIEVALGEKAQHVVVTPTKDLWDYLGENSRRFAGRVGFVWLEPDTAAEPPAAGLQGRPGVVGRADQFVQTEPAYAGLARRLLGQTWIVQSLAHALALADTVQPPQNYVTLGGELLAADGTLSVGPRHASTGLISRRSELRALRAQLVELEAKIQNTDSALGRLQQQVIQEEERAARLADDHRQAAESLAGHSHRITAAAERRSQLGRQRTAIQAELESAAARYEAAGRDLEAAHSRRQAAEAGLGQIESHLAELADQIDRLDAQRQAGAREATETKVELAKSEERLGNLQTRKQQFEESQQERFRAISETRQRLAQCDQRAQQARFSILQAESELAELYLGKERFAAETVATINRREAIQELRLQLSGDAQKLRAEVRKLDEKIHAQELAVHELRHDRAALADRLREDYAIELSELEHEPTEDERHRRDEAQQEIDELRRKINQLGNVNLEALEELRQLEDRHQTLAAQYQDLSDAKNALARIIDKINVDSRRLFAEMLQTVKDHFRTLFRDLFGGGQADILLEEGVDILESGIEIVARPPGKEPRSISLLSGGEKTLTCVALLLAIFRSRPSPFCVLDEVDAALDEANIDRFTAVLQGFLAWTQFVIVTHSKKTMTCADTMYGVTMQESGVSKQVSVRFEDVSDNGEIRVEGGPGLGATAGLSSSADDTVAETNPGTSGKEAAA